MSQERKSLQSNKKSSLQPLWIALAVIAGLIIGTKVVRQGQNISFAAEDKQDKLANILDFIDRNYVDTLNRDALVDQAIQSIVEDLDPHSVYISREEYTNMNEPLEGGFEGIGIEFMIVKDTLTVVTPLDGGPSAAAGIRTGDQIVEVEDKNIAGNGLTNAQVLKLLKGKKGTKVKLGIQRNAIPQLIEFNIKRDKIPVESVVAALKISEDIGYVKVTRFARQTNEEFFAAIDKLRDQAVQKLIIDLRGNGGGYLHVAENMIEEFLERGQVVVYTEGKSSPRDTYRARGKGKYRDMDVVVLIDEGSASASEIMAGALQDWDRSITIGRRSFGKGLVQREIPLPDSSALRLTIARYYTPTGRCIQKPYGEGIDYDSDYSSRYDSGELLNADSINFPDSLRFETPAGREVYGGGGIMPDIFVPIDTTEGSGYLNELTFGGWFRQYAFDYCQNNEKMLKRYKNDSDFDNQFSVSDALLEKFLDYASAEGVAKDPVGLARSENYIKLRLKAQIANNLFEDNGFYRVMMKEDETLQKGLEVLKNYENTNRQITKRNKQKVVEEGVIQG